MNEMFLSATRCKLRFATTKGFLSTEDLWDLSLKSLDGIAVNVDAAIKPERKSFLDNPDAKTSQDEELNKLRLEILKSIITIKQEENKAALAASSARRQKEFIKELIDKKKIGAMESMTIEELEAQLKAV